MINPGKYNKRITVFSVFIERDEDGFEVKRETPVGCYFAYVKTTRGMTLINQGSDFEKAFTNFTIRYTDKIKRDMLIGYNGKRYSIEYLNNVDENNTELEMQCREVTK